MNLLFSEPDHRYYNPDAPEQLWTSVTSCIHHYTEPFEAEPAAKKASTNRKSKWYKVPVDTILKAWEDENLRSRDLGHFYHNMREQQLLGRTDSKLPIVAPVISNGIKKCPEQKLQDGIYPEHMTYLTSVNIIGQSDLVTVHDGLIDIDDYKTCKEITRASYVNWEGDSKKMLGPLGHVEDCVAGYTKLLTRTGIEFIKDCIDKEVEIWNGKSWSLVTPFITGSARKLYRVKFSDGSQLDVTDSHIFLIKHRPDKDFAEMKTSEIIQMLKNTKWLPRIPKSNVIHTGGVTDERAYELGFILGDGNVYNNVVKAELHNEDKKIKFNFLKRVNSHIKRGKEYQVVYFDIDSEYCRCLKYDEGLPKNMFSWNKESILLFIAGWADADGCSTGSGIRIYGNEQKLSDAQLLLTKCGISTSVCLMQKAGIVTNLCERKSDIWYLSIPNSHDIPTQRIKVNSKITAPKRSKYQVIRSIEELPGLHTTYCLTEKELHQCVFNNVLTKQCNFNHYALQLSIYAFAIQRHNPLLRVGELTLEHVLFEQEGENEWGYPIYRKDEEDNYIVQDVVKYKLPYMKSEVLAIINHMKNQRK